MCIVPFSYKCKSVSVLQFSGIGQFSSRNSFQCDWGEKLLYQAHVWNVRSTCQKSHSDSYKAWGDVPVEFLKIDFNNWALRWDSWEEICWTCDTEMCVWTVCKGEIIVFVSPDWKSTSKWKRLLVFHRASNLNVAEKQKHSINRNGCESHICMQHIWWYQRPCDTSEEMNQAHMEIRYKVKLYHDIQV